MKRLAHGLLGLAILVGCSSMQVQTDFSQDVDFSAFKTFKYEDSDQSLAAAAPLAHQRVVAAIRQGMTGAGLTEVDSNPDLFVAYHGSTDERLQFQTTYVGVGGRGRWGRRGSVGVATSSTRAVSYEQGTLVIDVWEADENQLVWRGVVSDSLGNNPDQNTDKINRGVARAFENFPPN
jgi:hypothetical protein